jgi:malonate decarboxylase epsilon subunit
MRVGFLFPGQGSQRVGMLHFLPDHPAVNRTLEEASRELGRDITELDSEESLKSTIAVQIGLFTAGVAAARALQEEGVHACAVAGLSVGAFAAAVTSGALAFKHGIQLVKRRAELMENQFPGGYGLAAIVGLTEEQVCRLILDASEDGSRVYIGSINAPQQLIIAGSDWGMQKVLDAARVLGAHKAERLAVSVPSHCPLLLPVADALRRTLLNMELVKPAVPYVGNVRARPLRTAEAVAEDLSSNVAYTVRWYDTMVVLAELGCELFLEMQPGHVLTDLAAAALPQIRSIAIEKVSLRYAKRMATESATT